MGCRIMVVEDEIFVATEIEYIVEELGHQPVGIAADTASAFSLAPFADIALVDLNLKDGATGREIGRRLAEMHGVTVLYMTANPSQLGDGVPGTLGVLPKPVAEDELKDAVRFTVAHRMTKDGVAPRRLRTF
ncbi:response regulator [Rhizobium sp. YIM 134829]|uniref:response regulator n=1 Tax=Rhizobium sp. YIM 134829 TaxID=3390453 RepID=UPI00397D9200